MSEHNKPITVGRYLLHRKIARGGMATIHVARLMGDVGFSRIVAAKRMHTELAEDKEFVSMFLDEARIASKVHHRNVVPVLDVVTMGEEVVLVQEYVHGAPLSLLLRTSCEQKTHVPVPVAAAIACQVLAGLHAAHEAVDETGTALNIVHRDVSPQNIMVSTDGSARLLDFGVAKASVAAHVTRKGTFKGKLGYSSPEQIRGEANKQSDIYALGIVLWELLVGHRLHANTHGEAQLIAEILNGTPTTVTEALAEEKSWVGSYRWSQLEALEPIIRKALDNNYRRRWATAADMEEAIAAAVPLASATDIAAWLRAVGKDFLDSRDKLIAEEEASWRRTVAMTAAAVPMPSDGQASTGVATEAEDVPVLTRDWFRRGPTAVMALLVIALILGITLLARDLDSTKPTTKPATAAIVTEPAARAPTAARAVPPPTTHAKVTAKAQPAAAPPAVPSEIKPPTKVEIRDEREERLEDPDPPERTERSEPSERSVSKSRVSQKRTTPARTPSRQRVAKSESKSETKSESKKASAPEKEKPSPPPPSRSSSSDECTTPFYFKGNKKIFKPGCL